MKDKPKKWSALFASPPDEAAARFNASVRFDRRLAAHDIAASLAHAEMLAAQGILSDSDHAAIAKGLRAIGEEIARGEFEWREADEDVHFNIERRLIELVGDAGKRLHTARSRNDQVAADLRLFLRDAIDRLLESLVAARRALLEQAEANADTLTAGMTHLQVAQPIPFGHHLLAYEDMLARDCGRLADCRRRLNFSPLGAGALSGVGYPTDRERVAKALGFDGVCQNSMDAVSARDFAIEFAAAAAILMTHLSRFCEEVVLWCSPPFDCITLGDAFCTGSSMMPQKKNPDVAELIRGKTGRAAGALTALLMLMKGQPLAYNKDNQEDKEQIFDCVDTAQDCAAMFAAMTAAMRAKPERMRALLDSGYPTATELADYLVGKGMPFRDAHGAVAAIVRELSAEGGRLEEMSLEELQRHAPLADEGALQAVRAENAVNKRAHIGGCAPKEVRRQIARRRALLDSGEE